MKLVKPVGKTPQMILSVYEVYCIKYSIIWTYHYTSGIMTLCVKLYQLQLRNYSFCPYHQCSKCIVSVRVRKLSPPTKIEAPSLSW